MRLSNLRSTELSYRLSQVVYYLATCQIPGGGSGCAADGTTMVRSGAGTLTNETAYWRRAMPILQRTAPPRPGQPTPFPLTPTAPAHVGSRARPADSHPAISY